MEACCQADGVARWVAMARSMLQYTNPRVETWGAKVNEEVCCGPMQHCVTKEAKRKEQREKKRAKALQKWELDNPERKPPMVSPSLTRRGGCDAGDKVDGRS